jgi:hypothetical protein
MTNVEQHASPVTTPAPSQDPTIRMLAVRASTDAELKGLMQIVAAGTATREQLMTFQRCIDALPNPDGFFKQTRP